MRSGSVDLAGSWLGLLPRFVGREISSQRNRGALGWLWFGVTPVLLLSVYWFVFGVIFQARVPEGLDMPFIAWLAAALWPWLAFSDGVLRGAQSMRQHAALISKVAIPRVLLTTSTQTAAFVLQLVGYSIVLLVLMFAGVPVTMQGLPYLLIILATLYLFALGASLLLASIQVFVRDLEQLLPTLFMFWFFLTPILYAPEQLPVEMGKWLLLNPMTWWIDEIRSALFLGKSVPDLSFVGLTIIAGVIFLIGKAVFDRLSPHFEDFL